MALDQCDGGCIIISTSWCTLYLCYPSFEQFLFRFQAEFMEHDERPLPIDIRLLGALAEKVRFSDSSDMTCNLSYINDMNFYVNFLS